MDTLFLFSWMRSRLPRTAVSGGSSADEVNSPASGLDVAPSTSLPGVVISAAEDTLSTIPTEAVEDENISLNPDNQSPMEGMTGVHAVKDIPGPSTTKGKAQQEVT